MPQRIIWGLDKLTETLQTAGSEKIFLVCGSSYDRLPVRSAVVNGRRP